MLSVLKTMDVLFMVTTMLVIDAYKTHMKNKSFSFSD